MRCLLPLLLLTGSPAFAQLNADFSSSATKGCSAFTVQFQDKTTGSPTSWFWDFGNGTSSTLQNPSITYTTPGVYTVRLIVKNANQQDFEEKTNYITVSRTPDAGFIVSGATSGCVPLQSSFTDTTNLSNISVKSWLWDFGDGITSGQQNPTHTFTTAGRYDVTLTVTTTQGCTSIFTKSGAVIAGDKPVANFTASPLKGCASLLRNFKDKSTGNITSWSWDFGDGVTSTDNNPQYHYQDTGTFSVTLTVSSNGCQDAITIPNYIQVEGPVAKLNMIFDCQNRLNVTFKDRSIAETQRLWDFGDGQTSTLLAPNHVYAGPGIYTVSLVALGTNCNDTTHDTLRIQQGAPKITVTPQKNLYCRNSAVQFSITGDDSVSSRSFGWDFGDGDTIALNKNSRTETHVYLQNGSFSATAYLKDYTGCVDTLSFGKAININGPFAIFSAPSNGCVNTPVNFKEQSLAGPGAAITKWFWNFDDGAMLDTLSGNVSHAFSFAINYKVNLKVTDANGCTDSVTHPILISATPVVNAGADTFACAGTNVLLNATGAVNYVWQNSPDLSCTNCANPIATPTQTATYIVTGITNGCTASDTVTVNVQTKELLTAQSNYTICNGNSVMLNANGTYSYSWSPSNSLNNSSVKNPLAFPASTTVYTVIGKDSNNCFADTAFVNVTVNPNPTVNITDSIVQLIQGSTYNILATASNDAQTFDWSPASGLSCYDCLEPVASVTKTTKYTLTATNQFGCSDSDHITIIAVCTGQSIYIPNTFSPNSDGMNDYFYPRSSYDVTIRSLIIYNRWGQLVFQRSNFISNNANAGWDGKYQNILQASDVYIYVLQLDCSGTVFIKKGNVTLLR